MPNRGPFEAFLQVGGAEAALGRLSALSVTVVGCEGPGAHLAVALAACGVGELRLVDPFPLAEADRTLMPPGAGPADVRLRQDAIADLVGEYGARSDCPVPEPEVVKGRLADVVPGTDLLACCVDKSFAAAALWVNAAALDLQVPAGFARLDGSVAVLGPIVLPGEGPCYLCSRMRALACADDFAAAMGREELLDRRRRPEMARRPSLPPLAAHLGSVLALELLKVALVLGRPALIGHVVELDALSLETTRHGILQFPECPACRKKPFRRHPGLISRSCAPRWWRAPASRARAHR